MPDWIGIGEALVDKELLGQTNITFLEMVVIDLLHWDRRKRYGHATELEFTDACKEDSGDHVDVFDVEVLANLIKESIA